jgi:hypothetical protein
VLGHGEGEGEVLEGEGVALGRGEALGHREGEGKVLDRGEGEG